MLDRIRAEPDRQLDPVDPVGMDRNLAAIGVGGVDDRLGLVFENPGGEASARINPAGGGELDDVNPAADLTADRTAAIVYSVAEVLGADHRFHFVGQAHPAIHMSAGGRDRFAGIEDPRTLHPAAPNRLAVGQHLALFVAQVADRGEPSVQGLHSVPLGFIGIERDRVGHRRC